MYEGELAAVVQVDGVAVEGPGPDREVVFQEHAILPWRTVARNIGHDFEIQGVPPQAREWKVGEFIALMDEPFTAVDAQTRIASATRKTILFVTHNVDEAAFLGDRCFIFTRRPGRLKAAEVRVGE